MKYYSINEQSAKLAHDMMSMTDYVEGSVTAEYRRAVDKAYDIADKIAEKRPDEAERAYRLAERYSRKMAEYFNKQSGIGTMCPSVMISGAGNFPVRKKQKQVEAFDRNLKFYEETQKIVEKLQSILNGKGIIKSSDEHAIEKLEEKLQDMKELQEKMKAANKAIRAKDDEKLREMGYNDEEIEELKKPDFCGRIGYPSYLLQNNLQGMKRVEKRLEELRSVKGRESSEKDYGTFRVVENTEMMRYQVFFEGKPSEEVREALKSNGFKWAPSQGAWQRQITANGKYALERVIKMLAPQ